MNTLISRIKKIIVKKDDVDVEINIQEHHEHKLKELPEWIRDKGVEYLKGLIPDDDKIQIKMEYEKDNKTWWAMYHHGWGTAIRNSLRDNVCLDDELPSGNWDDYYVPLVEIACGLR